MSGKGKSYRTSLEKIDRDKRYTLEEGLQLVRETGRVKFDEREWTPDRLTRTFVELCFFPTVWVRP